MCYFVTFKSVGGVCGWYVYSYMCTCIEMATLWICMHVLGANMRRICIIYITVQDLLPSTVQYNCQMSIRMRIHLLPGELLRVPNVARVSSSAAISECLAAYARLWLCMRVSDLLLMRKGAMYCVYPLHRPNPRKASVWHNISHKFEQ